MYGMSVFLCACVCTRVWFCPSQAKPSPTQTKVRLSPTTRYTWLNMPTCRCLYIYHYLCTEEFFGVRIGFGKWHNVGFWWCCITSTVCSGFLQSKDYRKLVHVILKVVGIGYNVSALKSFLDMRLWVVEDRKMSSKVRVAFIRIFVLLFRCSKTHFSPVARIAFIMYILLCKGITEMVLSSNFGNAWLTWGWLQWHLHTPNLNLMRESLE